MDLIWFLLVGAVVGWLAGQLVEGEGKGFLPNMVIGVLGAIIGGYLAGILGIHVWGFLGKLVMSTLGAIVLLVILRLIRSSK